MKHLVLDIDEFLISSQAINEEVEGDLVSFIFENERIILRPFLEPFLKYCFTRFQISFSTRMTKDRCDFVLSKILKKEYIPKEVRTRENCYETIPPYGSKEIRKNSFDEDVIWIDDSPEYIDINIEFKQSIIKAEIFDGDIIDCYLLELIQELQKIRKAS